MTVKVTSTAASHMPALPPALSCTSLKDCSPSNCEPKSTPSTPPTVVTSCQLFSYKKRKVTDQTFSNNIPSEELYHFFKHTELPTAHPCRSLHSDTPPPGRGLLSPAIEVAAAAWALPADSNPALVLFIATCAALGTGLTLDMR